MNSSCFNFINLDGASSQVYASIIDVLKSDKYDSAEYKHFLNRLKALNHKILEYRDRFDTTIRRRLGKSSTFDPQRDTFQFYTPSFRKSSSFSRHTSSSASHSPSYELPTLNPPSSVSSIISTSTDPPSERTITNQENMGDEVENPNIADLEKNPRGPTNTSTTGNQQQSGGYQGFFSNNSTLGRQFVHFGGNNPPLQQRGNSPPLNNDNLENRLSQLSTDERRLVDRRIDPNNTANFFNFLKSSLTEVVHKPKTSHGDLTQLTWADVENLPVKQMVDALRDSYAKIRMEACFVCL